MPTVITKANIDEFVVTGDFDIEASFSADEDAKKAKDSKTVTLRFQMVNTPVSAIVKSSLKDKRINKQVGLRAKSEAYTNGQIILVKYEGEKYAEADPISTILARAAAAGMTPAEYLAAETAKRVPPTVTPLT